MKAQFPILRLLLIQETELMCILRPFTLNLNFIKQSSWIARALPWFEIPTVAQYVSGPSEHSPGRFMAASCSTEAG